MQSETTTLLSWSLATSLRLHKHDYTLSGCLEKAPTHACCYSSMRGCASLSEQH